MTKSLTEQKIIKIIENVTGKAAKVCGQKFYDKPKSLTEQWREGTLPRGAYYVNYQYNNRVWLYKDKNQTPENTVGLFEVLAPVPSYDEYKEMDNDLKEIASKNDTLAMENGKLQEQNADLGQKVHILNEANEKNYNALCDEIKKNKKLQEQLKEANEVIKKYAESDNWFEEDTHGEVWSFQKESKYPWRIGFRYLKKWGVK